ncbi:MAG: AraC family transcriptional regulator [Spirochaetes bacterium]|nr:AraC family transcriptional regulator [Spirochaetota bacterium]
MNANTVIFQIFHYFILHGIFLSFVMAAGQILVNRKSAINLIFGILFSALLIIEANSLLLATELSDLFSYSEYFVLPAIFALGPSLLLIVRYSIYGEITLKYPYCMHFFPSMLSFPLLLICNMLFKKESPILPDKIPGISYFIAGGISSLSLIAYLVIIAVLVFRNTDKSANRKNKIISTASAAKVLYLALLGAWLADFFYVTTGEIFFINLMGGLISFASISIFMFMFKYPDIFTAIADSGVIRPRGRTYLENCDAAGLVLKLHEYMQMEKPYCDESLTMPVLAEEIGITVHQLSELLNTYENKNFSVFINQYRVEEACRLLLSDRKKSIIEICFESGFNSKSAFNSAFVKIKNVTPSQYRENLKK